MYALVKVLAVVEPNLQSGRHTVMLADWVRRRLSVKLSPPNNAECKP